MDEESVLVGGTVAVFLLILAARNALRRRRNRRVRRFRTRPINRQRAQRNQFVYFMDMKRRDPAQFFKFTRMNVDLFDELLGLVESRIRRRTISDGITPEQRLAITLQ